MSVRRGHAGRVDNSQAPIIDALRKCGMTVTSLAIVGSGCPDLLVGWRGQTHLIECKTGTRGLTADEKDWAEKWAGAPVLVVSTPTEAVDAVLKAAGRAYGATA